MPIGLAAAQRVDWVFLTLAATRQPHPPCTSFIPVVQRSTAHIEGPCCTKFPWLVFFNSLCLSELPRKEKTHFFTTFPFITSTQVWPLAICDITLTDFYTLPPSAGFTIMSLISFTFSPFLSRSSHQHHLSFTHTLCPAVSAALHLYYTSGLFSFCLLDTHTFCSPVQLKRSNKPQF